MTDISVEEKSGQLLRLPEVLARVQVSKSTWWKGVKERRFPSPVYVTNRSPRWRLDDINRLMKDGVPRSRPPGQRKPPRHWGWGV